MSFNFAEFSAKQKELQDKKEIKHKCLIFGICGELTKYKDIEKKLFPTPYDSQSDTGYCKPVVKTMSTMMLKEIEKLKTFGRVAIPEPVLMEMETEFELYSRKAFEIKNGDDKTYSSEDQKKALGILGAEWLQRYFYIKTWILMIDDERYVSAGERKKFDSVKKWFKKIENLWEESILI